METIENALSIVLDQKASIDFFDRKALSQCSKSFNDITRHKTRIKSSPTNVLYVLLYNFLINIVSHKYKNTYDVMGVKIVFKGKKHYYYKRHNSILSVDHELEDSTIFASDVDVLFTMGSTFKNNSTAYAYFGNGDNHHCERIENIWKHRDLIQKSISSFIHDICEVDIYYYNVDTDILNTFIVDFITQSKNTYLHILYIYIMKIIWKMSI